MEVGRVAVEVLEELCKLWLGWEAAREQSCIGLAFDLSCISRELFPQWRGKGLATDEREAPRTYASVCVVFGRQTFCFQQTACVLCFLNLKKNERNTVHRTACHCWPRRRKTGGWVFSSNQFPALLLTQERNSEQQKVFEKGSFRQKFGGD